MSEIKPTTENKNILIMMANTGQCYAKLSYKAHKQYDQIQSGLTIPVIFFSTIIGTASLSIVSDGTPPVIKRSWDYKVIKQI